MSGLRFVLVPCHLRVAGDGCIWGYRWLPGLDGYPQMYPHEGNAPDVLMEEKALRHGWLPGPDSKWIASS